MPEIIVTVREKIAQISGTPEIVCGNSDYAAVFDLDSEWSAYDLKTARFAWMDMKANTIRHADVIFEGTSAVVPVLYDTDQVLIGVYAGDIHTTTPARVPCCRCITDSEPYHPEPPADIYTQLLQYLDDLIGGNAASFDYIMGTPIPLVRGFEGGFAGAITYEQ